MIQTIFNTFSDGHCGLGTVESPARQAALINRQKLLAQFDLCSSRLLTAAQQAGTDFQVVSEEDLSKERPKVDALITTERNIAVGVLTADCMPLLLADDENSIAAAVHLRRDSLIQGMDFKVVSKMRELGAKNIEAYMGLAYKKTIIFWIGKQV